MESYNTFNMINGSTVMPPHVLNDSLHLTTNNIISGGDSSKVATIIICALGLPGNVLVFAVYVRKMTTSMRVYMFALAVADLVVCVCQYLALCDNDFVATLAFSYIISTSTTFSMFLLVFVSIERLVAVKRPHSFSMDPQRAKKYMIIIVVAATIFTAVKDVTKFMRYDDMTSLLKYQARVCLFLVHL